MIDHLPKPSCLLGTSSSFWGRARGVVEQSHVWSETDGDEGAVNHRSWLPGEHRGSLDPEDPLAPVSQCEISTVYLVYYSKSSLLTNHAVMTHMEVILSLTHGREERVLAVQIGRTWSRKGKEEIDKWSSFFTVDGSWFCDGIKTKSLCPGSIKIKST